MGNVQSLSHFKWECIYYITWIPKYRKKKIYKELRKYLGEVFMELARNNMVAGSGTGVEKTNDLW